MIPALALATGQLRFDWHVGFVLFLLVSYGYVVNDIFDLKGDRENSLNRPLASGQLSTRAAWILAILLAAAALVLSAYHSSRLFLYAFALLIALFAYGAYLSTLLAVSNLWVAAMCASVFYLPLLLPEYSVTDASCLLLAYGVVLSFLYHLGREVVKDIEDMRGDSVLRRATLPLVVGASSSRLIAAVVFTLMIAASYYVYYQQPNSVYLWIVTFAVNLPIVLIFITFLRHDPVTWAGRASVALKVIMIPALAALVALGVS